MQVEIFTKTDEQLKDDWKAFEEKIKEECLERKAKLCKELGLNAQIRLIEQDKFLAEFPYKMMTEEEHWVYSSVFQTHYSKNRLTDYGFDVIPTMVLELWSKLKSDKVFDEYEIWTPELRQRDPLLIGRIKDMPRPFLIARWGEALVPYEEIKTVANTPRPLPMPSGTLLSAMQALGSAAATQSRQFNPFNT